MIKLLRENKRFVVGLFLLFIFRASFADHYLVPTGSMEPTLLPGDRDGRLQPAATERGPV